MNEGDEGRQTWPDAIVLAHEPSIRLGPLTVDPRLRRIAHDDDCQKEAERLL